MLASPITLLLYATATQSFSASYSPASPPNWLVYSYPISDIALAGTVFLGVSGGPFEVPHDYYGLGYKLAMSAVLPNGTDSGWDVESDATCNGQGSPRGSGTSIEIAWFTDAVGTYTAHWSITYGTSNDTKVANLTACDPSRLSYQTWLFNASFNVVDFPPDARPSPAYTTTTAIFPSKPTGIIFESNGAGSVTWSVAVLVPYALLVMLLWA